MCFRPPSAAIDATCPNCGFTITPLGGLYPPECPMCDYDLTEVTALASEGISADAPAAPGVPSVPGAPAAPGAPGAPKPPMA